MRKRVSARCIFYSFFTAFLQLFLCLTRARKRANPPPGIRRRRRRAAAGTARTKPLARRSAGRGSAARRRRENSRCSRARVSAAATARESRFFSCADFPRPPRENRKKSCVAARPCSRPFIYTRARAREKNRRRLSAATRTLAYSFSAAGGDLRSRRPPCFTAEYVRPASARRKSPRITRASALVVSPRARALARKSSAMVLSTTKMMRSVFSMAHIMRERAREKKKKKSKNSVDKVCVLLSIKGIQSINKHTHT